MLVETSAVYPEEREFGWRRLGFVRVVVSEHRSSPALSSRTSTRPNLVLMRWSGTPGIACLFCAT